MPKSGSTFLSQVVRELPEMRREQLVPEYQRREQELEETRIQRANNRTMFLRNLWAQNKFPNNPKPLGWIAQHHTRLSHYTDTLIDTYKMTPVLLVRNIYDVVPSLYDHLTNTSNFLSMAYVDEKCDFDRETYYDFIAEMIIPWYFNFFVSWISRPEIIVLTYEELSAAPIDTVTGLFERLNAPITREAVESAVARASTSHTRKNKAVVGRGGDLPTAVQEKVAKYASFYPHIDFSPIGLAPPKS